MGIPRSAVALLATTTLLAVAPVADAQPSLSTSAPTLVATPAAAQTPGQSADPTGSTLPLTGMDSALELVVAAALLGGGTAVRLGATTLRG